MANVLVSNNTDIDVSCFEKGLQLDPLPEWRPRDATRPHAPNHTPHLSPNDKQLAVKNALRYFPSHLHQQLVPEFVEELRNFGHIYMYRFRPLVPLRAYPLSSLPAQCLEGAAIMLMILNNLDPQVAQFPDELVTYGGNGQVFSNWAQFWIAMRYLSKLTKSNTLVLYSGHPHGLFPSSHDAPRAVITNGMVLPPRDTKFDQYERLFALGVTQYGQMTAGSFCYIGPQGIIHGTTLTLLNAMRKHLTANKAVDGTMDEMNPYGGRVFVSSGLGGMSGAQPKASVISGCIAVIAEISKEALHKRYNQGWLLQIAADLDSLIELIRYHKTNKMPTSIGYHGNVVDVWERLASEHKSTGDLLVDLGSDQTSCHNPFMGGYYPAGLTYEESREMMHLDKDSFKASVEASLRRHIDAINYLSDKGMLFFDYGNAFLLQASRAGADVMSKSDKHSNQFRYQSYVEDIMGDIFSLGFGPFRWVCTSCLPEDLETTDHLAEDIMLKLSSREELPLFIKQQYKDNIRWIKEAAKHKLVVGSQARILYSDQEGRIALAIAFNKAVSDGRLKGPVVLSRDHHDVSGTDSPYRETSSVYDGSSECTDMAVHNVIGDSFRGATWVALHNGGGVGWGEVINGGFGMLLDGSKETDRKARNMLAWDVSNGVARRAWAGNDYANKTIKRTMELSQKDENVLEITLAHKTSSQTEKLLCEILAKQLV